MKWLLITTRHTNPGDEFARMGVERAVRQVDRDAEIVLINKESEDIHKPQPFDRAIICGMPLFWSLPWEESASPRAMKWWKPLMEGWLAVDKKRLAAVGVGDVMFPKPAPHNPQTFESAVQEVQSKTAFVSVRASIPVADSPRVSCCPSAFEFMNSPLTPHGQKLCNFMVDGGHFPAPESERETWAKLVPKLSDRCRAEGFQFIAHNREEADLARRLSWPWSRIIFEGLAEMVAEEYRRASLYIGNRVHGAAVCAARWTPAWAITYDSRLRMARRLGAQGSLPSEVKLGDYLEVKFGDRGVNPQVEFDWTKEQLRKMG